MSYRYLLGLTGVLDHLKFVFLVNFLFSWLSIGVSVVLKSPTIIVLLLISPFIFVSICWHIECSTFTASSFRIWNSSTGMLSPPLALFVVCFLSPSWLHIPGCLALGEWSHHRDYLGREDLFCTVLLCILAISSRISEIPKEHFMQRWAQ